VGRRPRSKITMHYLDPNYSCLDHLQRVGVNDTGFDAVMALRPHARVFLFDDEASTHVGHFIADCGDLIIHNRQFALPPFETTYVQIKLHTMLTALGRRTSSDLESFKNTPPDEYVGYFIHGNKVWVLAGGAYETGQNLNVGIGAFGYDLDKPAGTGTIFPGVVLAPNDPDDEWARGALLLGSTIHELPDEDTRINIIRSIRVTPVFDIDWRRSMCMNLLWAGMGDIRNMWAALLMLNQTQRVTTLVVPWRSGLLRGKRHVYMAFNKVKVNLAKTESIRKVFAPNLHPMPRRRHDVRGHFMHINLIKHCVHVWPAMPTVNHSGIPHWQCVNCGGQRIWRKAHERGHSGEGYVDKGYYVTHE
jgi:hypothetical protein